MATVRTFWSLADHFTDHMLIADIRPDSQIIRESILKPEPVAASAIRVSAQRLLRSPGPLLIPSEQSMKDKMDGLSLENMCKEGHFGLWRNEDD